MKKIVTLTCMLSIMLLVSCGNGYRTVSTDGHLTVEVGDSLLTVYFDGKPLQVIEHTLGHPQGWSGQHAKNVVENYTLVSGKRCTNTDHYRAYSLRYPGGSELQLRLYDRGVALRMVNGDTRLAFRIPEGRRRWLQPFESGYEGFFPRSETASEGRYLFPALVEYGEGLFGLLTESGVAHGNSCAYLSCQGEAYTVTYTDSLDAQTARQAPGPEAGRHVHPWRVLMVGSLADIVESNLVTALAEPCRVEQTDWIAPGLSSWIYWAYNHSSKDFERVKEYIDLAADMGWPYSLIDWEWDQMANGGNIDDALAYAKEKGVKINLWYNSGTSWTGPWAPGPQDRLRTAEAREREMAHLEAMGVTGIKVDFFSPDGCDMVDYYLDILEDAARHHLLVDFHGCTLPRGWNRTWPNLMSMEAVYGAEWYNNNGRLTPVAAAHNATLPFTRNVVGPMDYTPCTFTDSQHPHITTDCHELALPILFETGLQHMADRPAAYLGLNDTVRSLLSSLPTAWDETLLLDGYPGEWVVMARRHAGTWYLAAINGTDKPLTLTPAYERLNLSDDIEVLTISDRGETPGAGFMCQQLSSLPHQITLMPRGGMVGRCGNEK